MSKINNPTILIICDGLGLDNNINSNAWKQARTPFFDNLLNNYPNSLIKASGLDVGLPEGQIGNSEVGHLTIGAGRIIYTGLPLINNSIKNQEFFHNKEFLNAFAEVKKRKSNLHVIGLLSEGGVHSSENHLYSILKFAKQEKIDSLYLHGFGDGRDVSPKSIISSIKKVDKKLIDYGYEWGSISGRYYAMDRDNNFERSIKAYDAMDNKDSPHFSNPFDYIDDQYKKDITDEFLTPTSAINNPGIKENDVVIFFNFRPDRARQLSHLLIGSKLYDYKFINKNIYLLSMMEYPKIDTHIAFKIPKIINPIGKVLEQNNLKQLRISETEKYAHVTFFMDGGEELEFKNQKRILIPSKKVSSFDLCPEMSAKEITDALIENAGEYHLTISNYANADMVGHTGNMEAAIKAMEYLDIQIARIFKYMDQINGTIFLTADHGNIEIMKDGNNNPSTKHTTNLVPLICSNKKITLNNGRLANVMPTILDYLNIQKPLEMDHSSLLKKE